MKSSHPASTSPKSQHLIRVFGRAMAGGHKDEIARAKFNLDCHIHRLEVKTGAMHEPKDRSHA